MTPSIIKRIASLTRTLVRKTGLIRLAVIALTALTLSPTALASTGEAQGRVVEWNGNNLKFEITRIGHMSYWADPPYGKVINTSGLSNAVHLIDGMLANWPTARDAIAEDQEFYLHNNRAWNQVFSIQSWPRVVLGEIVATDLDNQQFTVRYVLTPPDRVRHNPDQPGHVDKVITFDPDSDVIKYEGESADPEQAIQVGRHARVHEERKQTVLAFTPDALEQDPRRPYRRAGGKRHKAFVQQGFFRGYHDEHVYFAEHRDGQWIDAFREGEPTRKNMVGADMEFQHPGALLRPGDRVVFVPYAQPGAGMNSRMVFVRPSDDNSVEGTIIAGDGRDLTLEVVASPTGKASDISRDTVNVRLDDDAVYRLDGRPDQPRDKVLAVGNYVRVQPEWSGAVLVRDIDMDKIILDRRPPAKPYFIIDQMIAPDKKPFFHPDRIQTTENETVTLEVHAMALDDVSFQWRRNGDPIPGADQRVYHRRAVMSDGGSEFVCVATGPDGKAEAPPIVLEVQADTSELRVEGASIADRNTIQLAFNKPVDRESAEAVNHYGIDQGLTIDSANLIGDRRTVILKTSDLKPNADYQITVRDVHDLSATPNVLADNTAVPVSFRAAFRYLRYVTTEKMGGLNPRIKRITFMEDDAPHGPDRTYFGAGGVTAELAAHGFHDADSASVSRGEGIGVDLGAGNEIAPDAVHIQMEAASGRDVKRWKIEASNDREHWIVLHESEPDQTLLNGREYTFPLDLSDLKPEDILTGAKEIQTITFPRIQPRTLDDSPITLKGSASSELPVKYEVLAGPGKIARDQLTLTGPGVVRVRAIQPGSETFYAAHPVVRTVQVVPEPSED